MRYVIAITCFFMITFYTSTYNVSVAQVAEATIAKEVFKQAEPSVVLIEVYNEKGEVFGKGSGFIVSTDGKILTNYHVIEHTKKATVRLANGDAYDTVDVIDIDKRKDIALIKIRAVELKALTLGKSVTTEVGEKVYCLGNPLGALRNTLSEGIISALRAGDGYKYFQISAPISHGSSGSPVMNSKGEVIGIAVASIEEGQSLNFAIPIDYAKGMLTATGLQTLASIYEPPKEETTKADSYETRNNDSSTSKTSVTKLVDPSSLPEEMRKGMSGFFQQRIGVLTREDADKLLGEVIKSRVYVDNQNETFDILGYRDPTRLVNLIELSFSRKTQKLFCIYLYPTNLKIDQLRKILGDDDKKGRTKNPNGTKFYYFPQVKAGALTDKDDYILNIGYY